MTGGEGAGGWVGFFGREGDRRESVGGKSGSRGGGHHYFDTPIYQYYNVH